MKLLFARLRNALRMAEAHVQREKEELRSLHGIFERTKADCDRRVAAMEEKLAKGDAERREADSKAWSADERTRACDLKLAEAARREQVTPTPYTLRYTLN